MSDGNHQDRLAQARASIERRLRKVMCRTERLGVSADRNGMLVEVPTPAAPFGPADVQAFAWVDRVAGAVGAQDCIELWKSGAYLLNFMEDYELKRKVRKAITNADGPLAQTIRGGTSALLSPDAVRRYEPIDPGNARLRTLLADSIDRGGWRLLWIPASLPYYMPSGVYADPSLGGFTKALIFSCWQLVPKVIAVLGSYDAERRMVRQGDATVEYDDLRFRQRPLLRFALDEQRLTGMPLFTLLYPCSTLAQKIDPLEIGRSLGDGGCLAEIREVRDAASREVGRLLEPIVAGAKTSGPLDERWYWAALLLLDRIHRPEMGPWLDERGEQSWRAMAGGGEEDTNFSQHLDLAAAFFRLPEDLGPPPADLVEVIAKVALASPAVVALRALRRRWPDQAQTEQQPPAYPDRSESDMSREDGPCLLSGAAARIAMGFRALFNRPEAILLIRGMNGAEPYWERVLDYCMDGNLQAVVDEYVHVLAESMGLDGSAEGNPAQELADRFFDAVALRTIALAHDEFVFDEGDPISIRSQRLRCRYALRFGEGEADDGGEVTREDQVRNAFNSPFRPFILASTSVGQEGLDFHLYCRTVYHWNLPSNPVDLEQREGRIHRYKGHVIRSNLAARYGIKIAGTDPDPWEALFSRAASEREAHHSELVPYWILDGPWKIERRIPLYPLSREACRLEDLKRSLALYRLVFGQPRQEELLRLLQSRAGSDAAAEDLLRYRIDLTPGVDRGEGGYPA